MSSREEYLSYFEHKYKAKLTAAKYFADRYNGFCKIFDALLQKKSSDFTIIETGTLRKKNEWMDGQSSLLFYEFVDLFGGTFISIDTDGVALDTCREILIGKIGESKKAKLELIQGDGVQVLERLNTPADLVYLDSVDRDGENPLPSMVHHLQEFASLHKIIAKSDRLIVAVDDTPRNEVGKGTLVEEWARRTGKEFLHEGYQIVFRM